ncbi:hypothetical protein FH609_005525 [Streptomyces sp. 3MP-14]|uniref:DUF6879 domain-containing protein n=1 Tax=Streptomyces mimosae TaxID=2586635 RepID=A0A5N6ANQ8_9ACTN|nr:MULTISPECIES: DUF6879 family protein [Streptomyces]KAB8169752.1 hypothetical protein FH607_003205 [Streptomyces mimosae]KAB8178500.1 hypothetical protein FH609_005525 [Streptomyces sp. 3MP-14]
MLLDGEAWIARVQDFRQEAWRLETLPWYRVPSEDGDIRDFLAGRRISPQNYSSNYTEGLRRIRAEGRTKGRVHIVTRPLTDYLRFEFMYYEAHSLAGDDIRILDVTDRANPLEGVPDFWLFDRTEVVLMHYDDDGTQIGRELHEGDPAPYIEYQRIALAESTPFGEYVKRWPSSLTS